MELFVLGSPRSGTTLLGSFLASHPACCDLGEYYGFYLALNRAPVLMQRMPTPYRAEYLRSLADHAVAFAERARRSKSAVYYCDQTPWNLLLASELSAIFPKALFVLTIRHFAGVAQSLERSFNAGYRWAGADVDSRIELWKEFYKHSFDLPTDRTIAVSYDRLCVRPEETVSELERLCAARLNIDVTGFDRRVLARSHATESVRSTIACFKDDALAFRQIEPYDVQAWSKERQPDPDGSAARLFASLIAGNHA